MYVDLKTISVVLGIASSVVALVFKFMPRPADRLKRDLELLKLAREAKANHLPLQRHVDAQVNEIFLRTRLTAKRKFEVVFGYLTFGVILFVAIAGIVGAIVAFGAQIFSGASEATFNKIVGVALAIGAAVGAIGGAGLGGDTLKEEERELEEIYRRKVEDDKLARLAAVAEA